MTVTSASPRGESFSASTKGLQFPAGIALIGSQMRSTNLERDVLDELHSPYIGARAVDVLERVASALADPRRTRSWSFTGPYGSGKSTLSNLIDALLGPDGARRTEAETLLSEASTSLTSRLSSGRDQLGPQGFLGAVATARREPLVVTISRALRTAAERRWKRRIPKSVATALGACADPVTTTPKEIIETIEALCHEQPLLLVIDEFGKTLEHLAANGEFASARHDLFLLQELAEKSAGAKGLPLFLMTLQHLSFMDYAARSTDLQAREWAKIQGRFEDITFSPHMGDSVELMRRRLSHTSVNEAGLRLIQSQAEASASAWRNHGLNAVVDLSADHFADLYPLHPVTAVAAPFLAAQIGQHDRSLSGFLNNDEPHTVRRVLEEFSTTDAGFASTVKLPQLYDYFLTSGRTTLLASTNAGRWIEIEGRISEANGLPDDDQQVLKTVGMLNLIDSDGALSASAPLVYFALHEPYEAADSASFTALEDRLRDLVRRGFLVHRSFSGEYRVWRGTDEDIDGRVKENINRLDRASVVQRLGAHMPSTVVAGRHSQMTGMMRAFFTAVSGPETSSLKGPDGPDNPVDGLLVFHLGTLDDIPNIVSDLPVVLGTTDTPDIVLAAATHLVALEELLQDRDLDPVARREVKERRSQAMAELRELITEAFYPPTPSVNWRLWHAGIEAESGPGSEITGRSLSGLVSLACDQVFPHTPHIRNEMLGRHKLTSQASKARRELLTAMLRQSDQRYLGIEGYGPERAFYSGVLEYLGLHRMDVASSADQETSSLVRYGFSRPGPEHEHVHPVWDALEESLNEATQRTGIDKILKALMAPPYGVKNGVAPVLIVTALALRGEDVALFDDGSYLPRLTPDVVERMVKAPHLFEVKYTPLSDGQRLNLVTKLSAALNVDALRSGAIRNPAILSVTRALLEPVMDLTPYAKRTRRLSDDAILVRSELSKAQDPDDLLFYALPNALGLPPVAPGTRTNVKAATEYVGRLKSAADEISQAQTVLRAEAVAAIAQEFRLPPTLRELRRTLASRLRGFRDVSLNLELKGFVAIALNESLTDEDWLDPMFVRLAHSAIGDWTDTDASLFPKRVKEMAQAIDRVSHLYDENARTSKNTERVDARLLTLTDKSGVEQRTLIYVSEQTRQEAGDLAADVLKQAEKALGPDGARILLAALAQQLIDSPAVDDDAETKELQ